MTASLYQSGSSLNSRRGARRRLGLVLEASASISITRPDGCERSQMEVPAAESASAAPYRATQNADHASTLQLADCRYRAGRIPTTAPRSTSPAPPWDRDLPS